MSMEQLVAPFPWFGGKRKIVDVAWRVFDPAVPNYVEPMFGSGAVLLGRPGGAGKIETINEKDPYVANFFRSVRLDPVATAEWCDWPVVEVDVHARQLWLIEQKDFRERMLTEPEYFDPKIAGWWCWGQCCWIGGGWCRPPDENGEWRQRPNAKKRSTKKPDPSRQRPQLQGAGQGVHSPTGRAAKRQLPDLSGESGVLKNRPTRRRPMNKPKGVHAMRLPSLGNMRGILGADAPPAAEWMIRICERMRNVRICCGDWRRVLTPSVLGTTRLRNSGMVPCAVLLDPPYSFDLRDGDIYAQDDPDIAKHVAEWAREHGEDKDLRIILCGYEGEHQMPGWREYAWKAHGGYAKEGNDNADKERLWFSPGCLPLVDKQLALFERTG
jgi:hypothetical protein